MRRAEIIGLAVMFAHLAMPDVAQAPAMPEDVERSSIAVCQILRCFCIRLGIVQEDASLVGCLTVKDSANLDVSAHEPVFRGRKFNRHRPGRKCSCRALPARRRSKRAAARGSILWSKAAVPTMPMSPETQPCTASCTSSIAPLKSFQSVRDSTSSTSLCPGKSLGAPGWRTVLCISEGLVFGRLIRTWRAGWPDCQRLARQRYPELPFAVAGVASSPTTAV